MTLEFATQYFRVLTTKADLMSDFNKKLKTFAQKVVEDGKGYYKGKTTTVAYELEYEYVGGNRKNNEYVYHITDLDRFINFLRKKGIKSSDMTVNKVPAYYGEKISLEVNKNFVLRDYQKKYVNYIQKPSNSHKRVLIDLQTGKGKSLIGSAAACGLGKRIMLVVLPRYVEKWQSDIQKYTNATESDFKVVRGSHDMIELLEGVYKHQVIIVSTRTLLNYFSDYEDNVISKYPYNPMELSRRAGIGTLLLDEVHQEFYVVYKTIMYLNTMRVIGMSGTFEPNESKQKFLYELAFPEDSRLSTIDLDRYVDITAIEYSFFGGKYLRTFARVEFGYSQAIFEKSIMKKTFKKQQYFKLIASVFDEYYIRKREPGDKCLIFFSTIKMINGFKNYLKLFHKNLDIRSYTQKDPYDNIMEADVTLTTPGSAGTALDIPNLVTVIVTTSIGSTKLNIQMLGRLRNIPDKQLDFVYLWSRDIKGHFGHHKKRVQIFKKRGKTFRDIKSTIGIS